MREAKEEKDKTIEGRKEQTKIENKELINTINEKEATVEINDTPYLSMSVDGELFPIDDDTTSPLSIAVEKGHLNIVKHILENTADIDLSDTGKSPLFWQQKKVAIIF
jgi:ankyrin repeat protein